MRLWPASPPFTCSVVVLREIPLTNCMSERNPTKQPPGETQDIRPGGGPGSPQRPRCVLCCSVWSRANPAAWRPRASGTGQGGQTVCYSCELWTPGSSWGAGLKRAGERGGLGGCRRAAPPTRSQLRERWPRRLTPAPVTEGSLRPSGPALASMAVSSLARSPGGQGWGLHPGLGRAVSVP